MAQIYHAKPTSTKFLEGAIAGLLGGLAFAVAMVAADFLTPLRAWWSTFWLLGSILTGTPIAEINRFYVVNIGLGLLLHLLVFTLLGMGLVQYVPLFRRFKIDRILGGALYGVFLFVTIYWSLLSFVNSTVFANMNVIALIVASVLGGAVMGWWLKRAAAPAKAATAAT